jgi:hypothetical protein
MKLLKIIGIILLIPIAILFFPVTIGILLIWLVWKKIHAPKLRYSLIAVILVLSLAIGGGELANLGKSPSEPTPSPVAQTAAGQPTTAAQPTTQPPSYKVVDTQKDLDKNNQLIDETIYAAENPPFSYDEGKIAKVVNQIQKSDCKVDDCYVQLYDNAQIAQADYDFGSVDATNDAQNAAFDKKYPSYTSANLEKSLVALYGGTKITYLPLKNANATPIQTNGLGVAQVKNINRNRNYYAHWSRKSISES